MQNSLVGQHVSWQITGKGGSQDRAGTVVALAYDQTDQEWTSLIECDDGSGFYDVYTKNLRKVPR